MPPQTITLPAAGSVFSTQGVRESSVNSLVSQLQQHFRCALRGRRALVAACLLSLSAPGCKGRSVKYDNPVFEPAPPRRSLINKAADEEERRLMGAAMETDAAAETESGSDPASPFRSTSMQRLSSGPLTGNSVVALVNGHPVFLDDVLAGVRQMVENNPQLTDQQRQMILMTQLKNRLPKYVEDELIVQQVKIKVPKERQDMIRESLEPKFQETVEVIRKKENKATVQELDEFLSGQGISVEELRQSFYRIQMVEGYLSSLVKVPEKVDREELLRYYEDHLRDYSSEEKVRVAKIVVRPGKGGMVQAQQQADDIIARISQGAAFQDVAAELAEPVNREKRGDMGWISRGALAPELEDMVFALAVGQVSAPRILPDRVEIYSVTDRHEPSTIPFQQVQAEIEETLLNQKREDARREVRDQIRSRGSVQTVLE